MNRVRVWTVVVIPDVSSGTFPVASDALHVFRTHSLSFQRARDDNNKFVTSNKVGRNKEERGIVFDSQQALFRSPNVNSPMLSPNHQQVDILCFFCCFEVVCLVQHLDSSAKLRRLRHSECAQP